ncbi:MAG: response regulator transcription factor [Chloroflexota bacterium]
MMTRVLVIDDDPSIRQVIVFALSDEGFLVDEARDGQAALESVGRRHPDIIILDMQMPGMDGWAFAKHYRERYEHQAPIIVLTAAQDAARRGADIGAESYIAKPFDLDALLERVAGLAAKLGGDQ